MGRSPDRRLWSAKKLLYKVVSAILILYGTAAMVIGIGEFYRDGQEAFSLIILGLAGMWWLLRYDEDLEEAPSREAPPEEAPESASVPPDPSV